MKNRTELVKQTDELYDIAIKIYTEKNLNEKLTTQLMDYIWFCIYETIAKNGYKIARQYVESAKLLKDNDR